VLIALQAKVSLKPQQGITPAAWKHREPPKELNTKLQQPAQRATALLSPVHVQKMAGLPPRCI